MKLIKNIPLKKNQFKKTPEKHKKILKSLINECKHLLSTDAKRIYKNELLNG